MEASSPPCACGMSSSPHVSELALSATVCGPSSAWQQSRPKHVPVLHAVPCDWPLPSFAWSRAACAFALHAEIPYLLWNCGEVAPQHVWGCWVAHVLSPTWISRKDLAGGLCQLREICR